MKKTTTLCLIMLLSACTNVKQIGKVNMIANRNIDATLNYDVISTYTGGSKREVRKSRATSVENAIDQTVKKIPGGEYLMNAKIYLVNRRFIAVEGDVWGIKKEVAFRGFKVGDKVTWKVLGKFKEGIITSLKDDKTCLVKTDDGQVIEKKYDSISKIEQ